jgi:hypothetical protein
MMRSHQDESGDSEFGYIPLVLSFPGTLVTLVPRLQPGNALVEAPASSVLGEAGASYGGSQALPGNQAKDLIEVRTETDQGSMFLFLEAKG